VESSKLPEENTAMHGLYHDLRFAVRQLRKSPGFTASAILCMALGMAAGLLLTPAMSGLPYGVSAADPVSHADALAVLAVTGLVASYLPALKATRWIR